MEKMIKETTEPEWESNEMFEETMSEREKHETGGGYACATSLLVCQSNLIDHKGVFFWGRRLLSGQEGRRNVMSLV